MITLKVSRLGPKSDCFSAGGAAGGPHAVYPSNKAGFATTDVEVQPKSKLTIGAKEG